MFLRIVTESFRRQRRRKVIAITALMLGTSVAVAMLNITLDIGDKINRELKAFGANLLIVPKGEVLPLEIGGEDLSQLKQGEFLPESGLPKIKEIFWRNNILAFAPVLDASVTLRGRVVKLVGTWFGRPVQLDSGSVVTGMKHLNSFWKVEGAWIDESREPPQAMLGRALADAFRIKPGETIQIELGGHRESFVITGILTTGGAEDDQLFTTLEAVQKLTHREGQVKRVLVSALTTPESKVHERLGADARGLSPEEFERWYCTPLVSSIAFQLNEVFPTAEVKPIRQLVESEGRVLDKMRLMMALIAALALAASALAVMSTMMTMVLERRTEIGLMKAIGSGNGKVIGLFLTEAFIMGIIGGVIGCGVGVLLAQVIGGAVFGSSIAPKLVTLPLALMAAEVIALIGCAVPARKLLSFHPVEILRDV